MVLGLGRDVRERRGRFGAQARHAQLGGVDELGARLGELLPTVEQDKGALEVDCAILQLLDDLLQLGEGRLKAGRLFTTRRTQRCPR